MASMQISSKRSAITEDRLSSLPDDLLYNIMSFLTAQQCVQTCVLSRRWKSLWCSMPFLDIDQQEFSAAVSGAARGDRVTLESRRFEEFVNNLLMFHRASSLDRFRCHISHCYKTYFIRRLIRYGIKGSPAVMEVSCFTRHLYYWFPHSGSEAYRLKRLHLAAVDLDTGFIQYLRSGCPVLEDMQLDRCTIYSPEIASHTLKSLIVSECEVSYDTVLTITAPALISFHLAGFRCPVISSCGMPSLVRASIHLELGYLRPCKLLISLVNVRKLELCGSKALSILHEDANAFPTFYNLRTLSFYGCNLNGDLKILESFLDNAPGLEKLTIQHCQVSVLASPSLIWRTCTENAILVLLDAASDEGKGTKQNLTFQCRNLKWTEIKDKLCSIWSNQDEISITVAKD